LPELDYFRSEEPIEPVDINVRIEKVPIAHRKSDSIFYSEVLGQYGFSIVINRNETHTDVVASPLVGQSPHVLYTNVVEPLLRWAFVRKGYALMHGACIAFGGKALFITAKTDTGKTTTILHTIRNNLDTCHFLSDDMTIFDREGNVLSYPKPLTISQHTLQAVGGSPLTDKENFFLQIQSRLHSRSGRRAGMLLNSAAMPAATLNAIVQKLIPPPKFMVDRLIPGARYADEAQLTRIVLIERGPTMEAELEEREKVGILVANADDAYGFPPYPVLADSLSSWKGKDLHEAEQEIVASAIQGLPAVHLRSSRYDWYKRLPQLVNQPAAGDVGSSTKTHLPSPAGTLTAAVARTTK
jgi:hypothetical protein